MNAPHSMVILILQCSGVSLVKVCGILYMKKRVMVMAEYGVARLPHSIIIC